APFSPFGTASPVNGGSVLFPFPRVRGKVGRRPEGGGLLILILKHAQERSPSPLRAASPARGGSAAVEDAEGAAFDPARTRTAPPPPNATAKRLRHPRARDRRCRRTGAMLQFRHKGRIRAGSRSAGAVRTTRWRDPSRCRPRD